MKVQVYKFTGLSSLLMSNVESVNRGLPQMKLGTKPNKGDVEKIAEGMTYRDADGVLCMPTEALRSSLLFGCKGLKMPGSRSGPASIYQSLVFPAESRASLTNAKGKPVKDYEIQIDSGVNKVGSKKHRIIVVRPRINEWVLSVPFEIDEEFAPANFEQFLSVMVEHWNRAGRVAGIGAWRPENKGRHGKYSVEQV